jgi:hypothetical protein
MSFDQVFHESVPYIFFNVDSCSSFRHAMYLLDRIFDDMTLNALYDMTS